MELADFARQLVRTQRFTLGVPREVTISADGERVLFLRTRGGEDPVTCLWELDLGTGGPERLVIDPAAHWHGDDGELPEAERIRRERMREQARGIVAYSADRGGHRVAFALDGQLWVADVADGRPQLVPAPGPVVEPRLDPSGERIAYVSDDALHVADLAAGTSTLLAAPEHDEVTYGLPEHVAAESMHRYRGYWWAPDGHALLAARVDNSPVQRWWIADPANPEAAPRPVRYPAAGTPNADVSLHLLRLDRTRTEVRWDREAFEYLATACWDSRGPLISVQSRDQRTVEIRAVDDATGDTSLLHTERDLAWVELTDGAPLRTAAGRLVRVSDLTGSRRLVVAGAPQTPDGLHVREVFGADGECVYFAGTQEPTEQHLWRLDAASGELTRLTDAPGVHSGAAEGGTIVVLSRTEAGVAAAATRPGRPAVPVVSLDAQPLVSPRITWLRAGSRELRTALLLPTWYQEGTRLPVLMSPYGGPAAQRVLRLRDGAFCEDQWFAEHGFAVVVTDGRGTPGRGPAWDKTVFGDALSAAVEDQADALQWLGGRYPDLDLNRVGIHGWSFGGALAAMAVLRRPEVFHAAVSGAAPHDQRLYDTHWRERFLGLPQDNPEGYARSSTMAYAAGLTRPLLLIHGLADDNVVVAHTLRMSSALLTAGRPHRVLPLSGATHMPDENSFSQLLNFELDFLRETLGVATTG